MQNIVIAPSILSADFSRLGDEIGDVLAAGADWIHFDVMDNHFVPNLTVGPCVLKSLRSCTDAPIDVHIMAEPDERLISDFIEAGADWVTVHAEAATHLDRTLALINELGAHAGVALNPATRLDCLGYVMERIRMVLVMTVNPGFGGQSLLPNALDKVGDARRMIDEYEKKSGRNVRLEVDGGVTSSNIGAIARAGADTIVSGSAIFGWGSREGYAKVISEMKKQIGQARL